MPRTEEDNKKIRDQRKAEIMSAALELFATEGYHSTPISKIAKKAGVSKGLIYNYFDSKEDLIRALVLQATKPAEDIQKDTGGHLDNMDEFVEIVDRSCRLAEENPHFWKLYFLLITQPYIIETYGDELMKFIEPFIIMYVDVLKRAGSENPEADAFLIGAMQDGLSLNYMVNPYTEKFYAYMKAKMLALIKLIPTLHIDSTDNHS